MIIDDGAFLILTVERKSVPFMTITTVYTPENYIIESSCFDETPTQEGFENWIKDLLHEDFLEYTATFKPTMNKYKIKYSEFNQLSETIIHANSEEEAKAILENDLGYILIHSIEKQ